MKKLKKITIYLGLFPFFKRNNSFAEHVHEAAAAYGFLFAGISVSFVVLLISLAVMKLNLPLSFVMGLLRIAEYSVLLILAAAVVVCSFGVISGLIQVFRNEPQFLLSSFLRGKTALVRINFVFASVFVISAILYVSAFLIFNSISTGSKTAKVQFLYTLKEPIPEFVFKLSSLPLMIRAAGDFGWHEFHSGVSNQHNLDQAFRYAEHIVIGAHGNEDGLLTEEGAILFPTPPNYTKPKFIYFGSCYLGKNQAQWQKKFPNAQIKSTDDLYHPIEGWFYLMFKAPFEAMH